MPPVRQARLQGRFISVPPIMVQCRRDTLQSFDLDHLLQTINDTMQENRNVSWRYSAGNPQPKLTTSTLLYRP